MLGPVVCDIASTELTPQEARRIAHRHVGMVILFTRNYENPQQLARLCAQIHSVKPGVLIAVDHEGGRVQRFREGFTEIPSMHAYGEMYKNDPEAAARALTAAGFVRAAWIFRLPLFLILTGGAAQSSENDPSDWIRGLSCGLHAP